MSELQLRWLSAGLLVPPAFWVCYQGGAFFVAALSAFAAVGAWEFQNLLQAKGVAPQRALGVAGAALLPWLAWAGEASHTAAFVTVTLLACLCLQLGTGRTEGAVASVSGTLLGIFYVGWLLAHGVALRFGPEQGWFAAAELAPDAGFFFVVFALASAVGSDTAGLFVGRSFGRHPFAPRISPRKTVEGTVGAVLGGTLLGLAFFAAFRALGLGTGGLSTLAAAAAAATLAGAAIVGDLIESLFKRDAGIKDAGHLVPGVGGVLDRIDSALLAFPVMYYWLLVYYKAGT
jgi:phosphatidate cytidylyltransferase